MALLVLGGWTPIFRASSFVEISRDHRPCLSELLGSVLAVLCSPVSGRNGIMQMDSSPVQRISFWGAKSRSRQVAGLAGPVERIAQESSPREDG